MSAPSCLRVLELYSGVGGMHWALKKSGVVYDVVMAVDINTTANKVYKHNFPETHLESFGLEKLTLNKLESLAVDTILMSPPCQPFTRVGKKGDCDDVRTKSFLHILRLIQEVKARPRFLLVENVKGFESSQTHQQLVSCLENCGYIYQEFLLNPLQFGIPNSRLRYYLIARSDGQFSFTIGPKILTELPKINSCVDVNFVSSGIESSLCQKLTSDTDILSHNSLYKTHNLLDVTSETPKTSLMSSLVHLACPTHQNVTESCVCDLTQDCQHSCALRVIGNNYHLKNTDKYPELIEAGRNMRYCEEDDAFIDENSRDLSEFTESYSLSELEEFRLSDKDLRQFIVMDIVLPSLKKSTCFTKRYGHYADGAGSVIQMSTSVEDTLAASKFKSQAVQAKNRSEWGEAELNILRKLRLRYFTPREIANLLCFPSEFEFPLGVTNIQKYRLLGNSLNVWVVSELIKLLTQASTL